MPKINGNDIEIGYGDTVETLPHRLDRLEREHRYLRLGIGGLTLAVGLHALGVPFQDFLPFLFQLLVP
jgi:hypothetical protein